MDVGGSTAQGGSGNDAAGRPAGKPAHEAACHGRWQASHRNSRSEAEEPRFECPLPALVQACTFMATSLLMNGSAAPRDGAPPQRWSRLAHPPELHTERATTTQCICVNDLPATGCAISRGGAGGPGTSPGCPAFPCRPRCARRRWCRSRPRPRVPSSRCPDRRCARPSRASRSRADTARA